MDQIRDLGRRFNTLTISGESDRLPPIITKNNILRREPILNEFDFGTGRSESVKQKECRICKEICKDNITDAALERVYMIAHGKAMDKEKLARLQNLPTLIKKKDQSRSKTVDQLKSSENSLPGRSKTIDKIGLSSRNIPSRALNTQQPPGSTNEASHTITNQRSNILDLIDQSDLEDAVAVTPVVYSGMVSFKHNDMLDLDLMRSKMSKRMKVEMRNDSFRSLNPKLEKVLNPVTNDCKYYVTDMKVHFEALNKTERGNSHLEHMQQLLKIVKNPEAVQFWNLEDVQKKRQLLMKSTYAIRHPDIFARCKDLRSLTSKVKSSPVEDIKNTLKKINDKDPDEMIYWLVLDLEDTLVKTSKLPSSATESSFSLINHDGSRRKYRCDFRPFMYEFLERMTTFYNLVIYTSSSRSYAEKIVELIDPHRTIFKAVLCAEFCMKPAYSRVVGYR